MAVRGEWIASRKAELVVAADAGLTADDAGKVDLLIFAGQDLGELIDNDLLEEIPNDLVLPRPREVGSSSGPSDDVASDDEDDDFRYLDIAPAFREQVSKYGIERYALPIGGSTLVLVYRREAFSNEENVQAAKDQGIVLEPPTTWERLDELARFFQGRDWDGDGSPDYGLAAALGADAEGVADATFLMRAASLGWHRDHYSFLFNADDLKPRLDTPPFIEALEAVASWKNYGPPGIETFDVAAARAAFREGKTAFLIDRAEKAVEWKGDKPVSVAPLPGSDRVYEPSRKNWEAGGSINKPTYLPFGGGWLVGVRKGIDASKRDAAFDLALYLAETQVANRIVSDATFPMLSVRSSQMGRAIPDPSTSGIVEARSWALAVSRSLMADRVQPGLRIPGAAGYLADLSSGRTAAIAGRPAENALKDVVAAWSARSESLGRARQLWHYRRSLNTLATLPAPPPRESR